MQAPAEPRLRTLEEVRRDHIELVLAQVKGNKTAAAKILGTTRRTLTRLGYKKRGA
jgi:DNA-binding protein Fis